MERFIAKKRNYSTAFSATENEQSMYYKEMILFYLKEVKSRKRYVTEYDGESKLPNEKLDQLLRENPLEGVFDLKSILKSSSGAISNATAKAWFDLLR